MKSKRNVFNSRFKENILNQPRVEILESRKLLAVDLSFTNGPDPGPYGIGLTNNTNLSNLGESVAIIGDINGDGYLDMAASNPSQNYVALIFGSKPKDYLTISNSNRLTSVSNLVPNASTISGFRITSSDNTSQFGSSVNGVGDVNGDGFADFMIGAPYASNGSLKTGTAYLVLGTANYNKVGVSSIDISQTSTVGIRTITFTNTLQNSLTGSSVSTAGTFFESARPSIAIGASGASLGGLASNGAVYVVPNSVIIQSTGTINLASIGQAGGLPGVVFVGSSSNGSTGFSVSTAGDFNSDGIGDLLIGTPSNSRATLIYGNKDLLNKNSTLVNSGTSISGVWLNRIPSELPGIQFSGNIDGTGYAVSYAGDFNDDGISDFMIGSPYYGGSNGAPLNSGRVALIYGTKKTFSGSVSLNNLPAQLGNVQLIGEQTDAYTGYSLSAAGYVNSDKYSDVIFGAPGYANKKGRAYVLPGNLGLYGRISLVNSETNPYLETVVITTSASGGLLGTQVGNSVGGYYRKQATSTRTVDGDNLFDVITGVLGLPGGGAAYLTQGTYLNAQMPTPKPNIIVTKIGVDALPTNPQPFRIGATTPSSMVIYVLSILAKDSPTGVAFRPLTDIVASSVVVNDISYPGAKISASAPPDINNDGIPDAQITIDPRSNLGLKNGNGKITIVGLTTDTYRWTGSADILVTGSSSSGSSGTVSGVASGARNSVDYKQKYQTLTNGESPLPNSISLSRFYWKPLRYQVAYQQFMPNRYLQLRTAISNGTAKSSTVQSLLNSRRNMNPVNPIWGHKSVFTRNASLFIKNAGRTIPVRPLSTSVKV